MSTTIRPAEAKDLPQIIALERATPEAPHWPEAEYLAILNPQTHEVRRCLFIAESDETLIGFAVGKAIGAPPDTFAELESIAVATTSRRIGAGRSLCHAIIHWSRQQGASSLELEVRAASSGPIALYQQLGFTTVGRRAAYYHAPSDDALLMTLHL
jgi:[ribosomal protein S18]-alanine N-acetyltransferase